MFLPAKYISVSVRFPTGKIPFFAPYFSRFLFDKIFSYFSIYIAVPSESYSFR